MSDNNGKIPSTEDAVLSTQNIFMPATEALEIASVYFRDFADEDLDTVHAKITAIGPDTLCRDIMIVRETIERFMDIHIALQLQLQDMGYAVEVHEETPPPEIIH